MHAHRSDSRVLATAFAVTALATLALHAAAQTTRRASVSNSGAQIPQGAATASGVSADGRFVVFDSDGTTVVPGDTNGFRDAFVRDLVLGTTELVGVDTAGAPAPFGAWGVALTPDARFVLFSSNSSLAANDTNAFVRDGYVRDRVLATTELVTLSASGTSMPQGGLPRAITPDGRFIAFDTGAATAVTGDTNGVPDAFVRDRVLGTTELVSVATSGALGNRISQPIAITPDGRFVVFTSEATNLVPGDTNGVSDMFVRDRQLGVTERVSIATSGAEPLISEVSSAAAISADGRFVVFTSAASQLVPGDTNGRSDVFVRDRQLATTTRVSESASGVQSNGDSFSPAITADGSRVFFASDALNLVPDDSNAAYDVFVRDLTLGTLELVSRNDLGTPGDWASRGTGAYTSPDGRFVTFLSEATNLVESDTNNASDAFVRDRRTSIASICSGDGSFVDHVSPCPCGNTGAAGHGCAHSFAASGALLDATGSPAYDDVVLRSHATPATSFTLFLQHSASGDTVFHDGVLCASGTLIRLRGRNAAAGEASFPNGTFANDATTTLSQRGGGLWHSGVQRFYSAWYRNAATTFCPPATANVTNGIAIDW